MLWGAPGSARRRAGKGHISGGRRCVAAAARANTRLPSWPAGACCRSHEGLGSAVLAGLPVMGGGARHRAATVRLPRPGVRLKSSGHSSCRQLPLTARASLGLPPAGGPRCDPAGRLRRHPTRAARHRLHLLAPAHRRRPHRRSAHRRPAPGRHHRLRPGPVRRRPPRRRLGPGPRRRRPRRLPPAPRHPPRRRLHSSQGVLRSAVPRLACNCCPAGLYAPYLTQASSSFQVCRQLLVGAGLLRQQQPAGGFGRRWLSARQLRRW